ncbi:MAG: hypothetical protein GEU96_05300 [Propionibacteriales bacterium]|nr:hypothetical protein [Propionibacteriales bacterium]
MSTSPLLRALAKSTACVVLAAGCGGAGASGDEADNVLGSAKSATPSAKPAQVQAAPADLTNFSCRRQSNGVWAASGDITNSAKEAMVYTLTVVTVSGGDQVVAEKIDSFRLKPDQTREFDWAKVSRADADTCMPHVQRKPA